MPGKAQEYKLEGAMSQFLLTQSELDGIPCRTVRNLGKPTPDTFYAGDALHARAVVKFGGEEGAVPCYCRAVPAALTGGAGFCKELRKFVRCYRPDPANPPVRRPGGALVGVGREGSSRPRRRQAVRYMVLCVAEKDVGPVLAFAAAGGGGVVVPTQAAFAEAVVPLFHEASYVCVLLTVKRSREYRAWGMVRPPPAAGRPFADSPAVRRSTARPR